MRAAFPSLLVPALALAVLSSGISAQERLVPAEQVRYDYAQVLNVRPVYQTVTVGARERQCTDLRLRSRSECREVQAPAEFRRVIAYDVEYSYRGDKFRSRLAEDPGRRLRIRVGVTPMVASEIP